MGRLWRIVQLFVVALATAHDVVLLLGRQCGEAVEVVLPLLDGHKAAAVQSGASIGHDGGVHSRFIHRVFSAVFVAGQVTVSAVTEAFGHLQQVERRRQRSLDGLAAVQQLATVFAQQPQPQGVLGRRVFNHRIDSRKHPQARDLRAQCQYQRRTKTGHHAFAIHPLRQGVQCSRQSFY